MRSFIKIKKDLNGVIKRFSFTNFLLLATAFILLFGLFKGEISSFKKKLILNLPSIEDKITLKSYSCKGWQETDEWLLKKEEINGICSHQAVQAGIGSFNEVYKSCSSDLEKDFIKTKPKSIEVNATCYKNISQKWFWAFGKYWFKIGEEKE